MRKAWSAILVAAVPACVQVPADAGFGGVSELVDGRLEQSLHWYKGSPEDEEVEEQVRVLLAVPLTVEGAVQIALLRNRRLQAVYEELGIAQADLVQAGLLRNPVFLGSARLLDRSPSGTNVEFSVVQDFLDILVRSARKALAEEQFEQTRYEVANAVLDLAVEVRVAWFEAVGAAQIAQMRRLVADAAGASADLASRIHEAGNLSDLELVNHVGLYEDTRVAWAHASADAQATREELTRAMGLWGTEASWILSDLLAEIPPVEVPLEQLESRAVKHRLDLAAARKESEVLARALGIQRDWRYLGLLDVGVSTERDTDGQHVTGPEITLELPLFDQRQAKLARGEALLRQSDQRLWALAVEIRSEVRSLRDRLLATRQLAEHYRNVVIPLRESVVAFTQQEFNFMLVGAFHVIHSKQAEYDAYHAYLEAVRDYWITRARLAGAVGGALSDSAQGASDTPPELRPPVEIPQTDPPVHHQHHPQEKTESGG